MARKPLFVLDDGRLQAAAMSASGLPSSSGGGAMVLKEQVFTASGTFTPSAKMIAQGGHCEVLLVGGGGGATGTGGGSGGCVKRRLLAGVVTPQTVTIGAGGAVSAAGGATSFGAFLSSAGGNWIVTAGEGSGPGSVATGVPGGAGAYGFGHGGSREGIAGAANTGNGGSGNAAGGSGIAIIRWPEAV